MSTENIDQEGLGDTQPLDSKDKKNVVVKAVDMSEHIQTIVIDIAQEAIDKSTSENGIAAYLKKELDSKYGRSWQCVVGRNFGSFITHDKSHFIYFYVDDLAFLIFRCSSSS